MYKIKNWNQLSFDQGFYECTQLSMYMKYSSVTMVLYIKREKRINSFLEKSNSSI